MDGISASPYGSSDHAVVLARTAELGEYFALPSLGAAAGADLTTLTQDEATVCELVARTRSAIATSMRSEPVDIPVRVAASSFQLNVVARLISPVVGAAVAFGEVPLLTPHSVAWRTTDDHRPDFGTTELEWACAATPMRAAELMSSSILATVVGPLNDTLISTHGLSTQVSWGNTISAVNGAVTVMAMSRPNLAGAGQTLVRALLDTGPLRRTGAFVGVQFVRHSCCLFYRAPQGGLCQDCVLSMSGGSHSTRTD